MPSKRKGVGAPEALILSGCALFVFILWLSAYFDASIRWLHFVQAWMYLATAWLAIRRNRWGYFIGITAAGLWAYAAVFVNSFFASGLRWLWAAIRTGHLRHVDQIIAVPAWSANVLVVAGCLWAYSRMPGKKPGDVVGLAAACALTMGFFAADMALFQPRYLPMFRGLLHPHSPW
jgi:hypothetical protein